MPKKIHISPVTRINGYMAIEVLVEGGQVIDAKSIGSYFRGFELILQGRDPRDAPYFTQRICGICSSAHAYVSALAVENAYGINEVPVNAVLLRNLIFGADTLQNHVRQFYLLTIPGYIRGPDQPPFRPHYTTGFKTTKEQEQTLINHYIESLEIARLCHEMVVVFGGKVPHNHGIVAGGATVNPDADKISMYKSMLNKVYSFIKDKFVPDAIELMEIYSEYKSIGLIDNMLGYGMFVDPQKQNLHIFPQGLVERGVIKPIDPQKISEYVTYSWYNKDDENRSPGEGATNPDMDAEGYSWIKAPRYDGEPMAMGPIARLWLTGEYREGTATAHRKIARALEAKKVAELCYQWLQMLEPGKPIYLEHKPLPEAEGVGMMDVMRGGLGHWFKIKNGLIDLYQVVTPSAWNLSPEGPKGKKGVVEQALIGTPVEDTDNPIEIGRVVRSFDPCASCAVHVYDVRSNKDVQFIVR